MVQEKKKSIPAKRYVCCPMCGRDILQGELAVKVIIRCDKCHLRVLIEILDGKTTTIPYFGEE